jgi:hypothetical protein
MNEYYTLGPFIDQPLDNNKKTQRDGMMKISFIHMLLFQMTKFFLV